MNPILLYNQLANPLNVVRALGFNYSLQSLLIKYRDDQILSWLCKIEGLPVGYIKGPVFQLAIGLDRFTSLMPTDLIVFPKTTLLRQPLPMFYKYFNTHPPTPPP